MSLAGKTINRYRIIEQLGQGGMAVVYKAFDTRLQRDVALKVIRIDTIPPVQLEQFFKRFEREALAQAKFEHPNIVPVYDYGEHEGVPYLVMAYRPGGTVNALTGVPMDYPVAASILAPIADALDYAHKRDVIHRDVKPSNILLGEDGKPALTDFGIAKLLGEIEGNTLTGTGMGIGTPQYMAPEQWTGNPGKATDIYALGVVFYELVTGKKPYNAETPAALLLIQQKEPLPRPSSIISDLPDHVEKVMYRALAPNPDNRYDSMAEFARVLRSLGSESYDTVTDVLPPTMPEVQKAPVIPTQPDVGHTPPHSPESQPDIAPPPPSDSQAAYWGEEPQPPQQQKFKLPIWGWGLIGLGFFGLLTIGIMLFALLLRGGSTSTPVAGNSYTPTSISALGPQDPTATREPTAELILPTEPPAVPTNTPKPAQDNSNNTPLTDRYRVSVRNDDPLKDASNWNKTSGVTIQNGQIELKGTGDYDTVLSRAVTNLNAGQGIIITFNYTSDAQSEIYIQNTNDDFYTWGIYMLPQSWGQDSPFGKNYFDSQDHNYGKFNHNTLVGKAGADFVLFLGIEDDGTFIIMIWKESNPSKYLIFEQEHPHWTMSDWDFRAQGKSGELTITSYTLVDISD